ncbi:hypothetical protein [Agromyces sp. NPDC057865]|uniref:hypothetical protein n=1 Tax=Agromyces sp. NPDC057865 TaxID=3346267 RepID=UPI00366FA896
MPDPSLNLLVPSLRTAERPMAFTFGEFMRGAFFACGWFWLFSLACFPIAAAMGWYDLATWVTATFYTAVLGGVIVVPAAMLAALIVWSPIAYVLGWSLRRVGSFRAHLTAFAALGLVIGTTSASAVFLVFFTAQPAGAIPFAVAAALAVPLGWYRTARFAVRACTELAKQPS